MRLISQVAKEIWIVDKGLRKFPGDINDFKMDLRKTMVNHHPPPLSLNLSISLSLSLS
jgi:hypothetical protein